MTLEDLDAHLEPLTQALVALTDGRRDEVHVDGDGSEIIFAGGPASLALTLVGHPTGEGRPNDFRVSIAAPQRLPAGEGRPGVPRVVPQCNGLERRTDTRRVVWE